MMMPARDHHPATTATMSMTTTTPQPSPSPPCNHQHHPATATTLQPQQPPCNHSDHPATATTTLQLQPPPPSVKVGGVPQCSGEVEHCGTLGTPAPFQSSVEWCGTAWNGCALTTPVTPCHHLSTLGTEKY